jgi:hypothetical protein
MYCFYKNRKNFQFNDMIINILMKDSGLFSKDKEDKISEDDMNLNLIFYESFICLEEKEKNKTENTSHIKYC